MSTISRVVLKLTFDHSTRLRIYCDGGLRRKATPLEDPNRFSCRAAPELLSLHQGSRCQKPPCFCKRPSRTSSALKLAVGHVYVTRPGTVSGNDPCLIACYLRQRRARHEETYRDKRAGPPPHVLLRCLRMDRLRAYTADSALHWAGRMGFGTGRPDKHNRLKRLAIRPDNPRSCACFWQAKRRSARFEGALCSPSL